MALGVESLRACHLTCWQGSCCCVISQWRLSHCKTEQVSLSHLIKPLILGTPPSWPHSIPTIPSNAPSPNYHWHMSIGVKFLIYEWPLRKPSNQSNSKHLLSRGAGGRQAAVREKGSEQRQQDGAGMAGRSHHWTWSFSSPCIYIPSLYPGPDLKWSSWTQMKKTKVWKNAGQPHFRMNSYPGTGSHRQASQQCLQEVV